MRKHETGETEIRRELSALGLKWSAVKQVLPDWAERAFDSPAGAIELKGFLARHLGLEISREGSLGSRMLPSACFKTYAGTTPDQVESARGVVTACARLIARATMSEWKGIPEGAREIRGLLLGASRYGWIDFEALLDYAWRIGIPVLYLPDLPVIGRKMVGMVTFVAGRPVVVLTKKQQQADWMAFILAHEIGHIARGHLPLKEGEAIVDDAVKPETSSDDQEEEANQFAETVMSGDVKVAIGQPLPRAKRLAEAALDVGQKNKVSPGHVILKAVWNTSVNGQPPFSLGQAALKELAPLFPDASVQELCRQALRKHIDIDTLRDDSVEYLEKLSLL
jgi:hypothetical protein